MFHLISTGVCIHQSPGGLNKIGCVIYYRYMNQSKLAYQMTCNVCEKLFNCGFVFRLFFTYFVRPLEYNLNLVYNQIFN